MLYLVGDLQGCDDALERLLSLIDFSPSRARLVVLGDLVNRGPGSLAVLRRLRGFGDAATCLLGNHDLHLLAVAHGARTLHRGDTFGEVLADADRQSHLEWLRTRPLACEAAGWLCVHAGVVPQWNAHDTLALADEVSAMLRGPGLPDFLHAMYCDTPTRWAPDLHGLERWRFVVNVLTRIRFCSPEGELDLKTKEGSAAARPGFMPWFEVPGRRSAGQPVACGHWSTLGLVQRPDLLAIDTGCVWGGALTAVRVDGGRRELVQVPCAGHLQPGP
ncbi:MAG: symmetrical bis(5'-nucleosyl)-tetraphosphatase [Rubrivivax sp.]|nr:symmetrical bis(5'-nucleosyl)-tetraphosphatase [Rubrivivax sp.]